MFEQSDRDKKELKSESDLSQDHEKSVLSDEGKTFTAEAPIPGLDHRKTKSETLAWPLWVLVVISLLSTIFLFALDNTIVAVIQPKIVETFGNAIEKLPWLSVAFPLGSCGVNLVWLVTINVITIESL